MKTCFACGQTIYPYPVKDQRPAIRDNFKGMGYVWLCLGHSRDAISTKPLYKVMP